MNTKRKRYFIRRLTIKRGIHILSIMGRPKTKQDDKIKRTTLQMPVDLAEQVSDWRFEARLPHWNDAVLELVRIGLETKRTQAAG
jgi:hypothetical protein